MGQDELKSVKVPTVAVVGLGYVGCVSAACLAHLGHKVIGIDRDENKVASILRARAPFYEPGLEELIAAARQTGRLEASTSVEALDADIVLICVGTPSERNGNLDLSYLRRCAAEIAGSIRNPDSRMIVAVRSTVYPGTCEDVVAPYFAAFPNVRLLSHPEFLREGSAVKDFLEPALIVVGGEDRQALSEVAELYAALPLQASLVSLRTAELIKYSCNAFHALKVSFANEIASLAGRLGIDGDEVMQTLCQDEKLNVSRAYLKPGFAFGGSCLPKDLRAISYRASTLGIELPMLSNVLRSNEAHLQRCTARVLDLPGRLGILGLSFKENTDDLRESPVVQMLEVLIGKGRDLVVYDPHIKLDDIYGSNRNYLLNAIPHIGRLMSPTAADCIASAESLVVTQKLPADCAALVAASGKTVIDLTRAPNLT
jgi:GDP-mannose 6-dehydrogenase